MTLRNRLGVLFISFLTLVTVSVVATAWMVHDQNQDGLVINLAGRQRMLVQQMTAQALQIDGGSTSDEHRALLREAETAFDRTLSALMFGGETPYLPDQPVTVPATGSDAIQARLRTLEEAWIECRTYLHTLETAAPGSADFEAAIQSLQALAPSLVEQADDIVRAYEAESERKLTRLEWIQAGFFLCALGLLVAGVVMSRRAIMQPLGVLRHAAQQIGRGDLSSPVPVTGPPELAALAVSVDTMRAQLRTLTDGLEAQVSQRTRELSALYDVIREISSHLEIGHVLESVTGKARDLLNSEVAFLCLLDDTGETLTLTAYHGPPEAVCGRCVLAQHSIAGQVLGRREAMICDVGGCQTIAANYRASHLAAPLRVGERVIGALCVGSTRAATYSQDQVRLLTELANSTAIALENARLYGQAERVAALEERQRIAADMHDGLAQTLSYIKLKTGRLADLVAPHGTGEAAQELRLITEALDRVGDDVRQSIASLRAEPVPARAIQEHLTELVAAFAQSAPELTIEVDTGNCPAVVLSDDKTAQIVRVAQEALQNACRHARASRVCLYFDQQDMQHQIVIQDDGSGFDPAQANGKGHFGVSIMQARAARIGGTLAIDSTPDRGTRVTLRWPR